MTIDDIADYIIFKSAEDGRPLNLLKLQKLAYYTQAWHFAIYGQPIAPARFQAWVHGPVSRELYDRFRSNLLFEAVTIENIRPGFNPNRLDPNAREFIDAVLEEYGKFSGSQLEDLTHSEAPWIQARGGRSPIERCENELDETLMGSFYRARIQPPAR